VTDAVRGPGRPRSAASHDAALRAAEAVVSESGVGALTFQAISERSGVSRATLYKWWPSPAAILFEALMRATPVSPPPHAGGGVREALAHQMRELVALLTDPGTEGVVARAVLTQGVEDPAIAASLRELWWAPRRAAAAEILEYGMRTGAVREMPMETAIDLLFAPLYFRLLYAHAPLGPALVDEILDACGFLYPGA
jgi:AcrR family transcriptional regulator